MNQTLLDVLLDAILIVPPIVGAAIGIGVFRCCRRFPGRVRNPVVLRAVSALISAFLAIWPGGAAAILLIAWHDRLPQPHAGDDGGGLPQMIELFFAVLLSAIAGLIFGAGLGQRTRRR